MAAVASRVHTFSLRSKWKSIYVVFHFDPAFCSDIFASFWNDKKEKSPRHHDIVSMAKHLAESKYGDDFRRRRQQHQQRQLLVDDCVRQTNISVVLIFIFSFSSLCATVARAATRWRCIWPFISRKLLLAKLRYEYEIASNTIFSLSFLLLFHLCTMCLWLWVACMAKTTVFSSDESLSATFNEEIYRFAIYLFFSVYHKSFGEKWSSWRHSSSFIRWCASQFLSFAMRRFSFPSKHLLTLSGRSVWVFSMAQVKDLTTKINRQWDKGKGNGERFLCVCRNVSGCDEMHS